MTDTDADGSPRRRKAAVEPPATTPAPTLRPASMLCAAPRVVLAVASMWIIWLLLTIFGGAAYAYTIYPDARFPLQLAAAALIIQLLVLIYLQPDVITDLAELYEPRIVWRAHTKQKIAALTIDDVPVGSSSKIEEILALLEQHDAVEADQEGHEEQAADHQADARSHWGPAPAGLAPPNIDLPA